MANLSIALLIAFLALGANTWGQNSTKDSRQPPTIEDRIGQLEQKQDDLSGQVDALNQKVTSLQQEIKFLEQNLVTQAMCIA
jgi:peptidoglycan hydrolase CwlO-like protein